MGKYVFSANMVVRRAEGGGDDIPKKLRDLVVTLECENACQGVAAVCAAVCDELTGNGFGFPEGKEPKVSSRTARTSEVKPMGGDAISPEGLSCAVELAVFALDMPEGDWKIWVVAEADEPFTALETARQEVMLQLSARVPLGAVRKR